LLSSHVIACSGPARIVGGFVSQSKLEAAKGQVQEGRDIPKEKQCKEEGT
jgi:hypothetical protein